MSDFFGSLLYHTKDYQGTTTHRQGADRGHQDYTIPRTTRELQPDGGDQDSDADYTIPRTTRELQLIGSALELPYDYTIPRTTRELQLSVNDEDCVSNYTIPRTTRELQLMLLYSRSQMHYTIPRTTRELQPLPLHRGGRVPGQRQGLTSLFPTAKRHNSPGRETSQRIVKARSDRTSVAGICPALHFVQRILP